VKLREFEGVYTNPVTLTQRRTDEASQYTLQYSHTSVCTPQDRTLYWVEVSADGYDPRSTYTGPASDFDPRIYCTEQIQLIDFALQRTFGWVRATLSWQMGRLWTSR
jgi:hypothetical protein